MAQPPTRILVISHLYPRSNGRHYGVFVQEQVEALARRFPDLHISVISPVKYAPAALAFFSERWRRNRESERERVDFGRVKVWFPRYLSLPRRAVRSLAVSSCYRALRRDPEVMAAIRGCDLILAHTASFDGRLARRLGADFGKRYWVYIHGEDVFQITHAEGRDEHKRAVSRVLASAEGVVAVSDYLKGELDKAYSTSAKSHVVHNGVDLSKFNGAVRAPEARPSLLTAGRLKPTKAHRYVLEALAALKEDGLELDYQVAGDGETRKDLEIQAARLGLSRSVTFSGRYDHASFPNILRKHDLFVMPSWDEGFGVVYLEAMAMGLPVVAANDAGARDVVSDGIDGFLVPPKDSRAIADAIRGYAGLGYSDKVEMSRMALDKARRFSWEENAERLYALLGGDSG